MLMLDKIDLDTKISKKEYTDKMEEETNRLGFLQRSLRDAGVPVIILFEGFRGTFRSELISKVISALDPRGFRVFSASKTTDAQKVLSLPNSGMNCRPRGILPFITGPGIFCAMSIW